MNYESRDTVRKVLTTCYERVSKRRNIKCQDECAISSKLHDDPAQREAAKIRFVHNGEQKRVVEAVARSGPDWWLGDKRSGNIEA